MKAIQRIPTDQFAYVELEMEYDTPEDAFIDHQRLLKLHEGGVGLDARKWKEVRLHMMHTGEFDPNLFGQMNKAQKWWVNETKKTLRDLKSEDPIIN